MLTCYGGLRCHSGICLDWREICDGVFQCEYGEDEPDDCLQLELNECQNDEYRCRNGMCIPRTFFMDFTPDCMDLSDEDQFHSSMYGSRCYSSAKIECDFRMCDVGDSACGDGTCVLARMFTLCNNGRDRFLHRTLLLSSLANDSYDSNGINSECWLLMLCMSAQRGTELFDYDYSECECTKSRLNGTQCLEYFQNECPQSFFFQNADNTLYPFVRFLYHNTSHNFSAWWLPSHFCYNTSHCSDFPLFGLPLVAGFMCIGNAELEDWFSHAWKLPRLFSACTTSHISALANDSRLFYCERSRKYISKNRVRDSTKDCYFVEDESDNLPLTVLQALNFTDRIKCVTIDEWLPRLEFGNGICNDGNAKLHIDGCTEASDFLCQFVKGLYSPPIYYVFKENCNGNLRLRFHIENETDETSCDEWPAFRCDDYWDLKNGEDELNCSSATNSFMMQSLFKCNVNEHYCAHLNGTMGCLSKERAGDGIIDCLGATDEQKSLDLSWYPHYPFRCSNGTYLRRSAICNGEPECPDHDDELMCPWLSKFDCDDEDDDDNYGDGYFICKDGTCLDWADECDNRIDCHPDGEDEWFCRFGYRKITTFSLDNIEKYPSTIIDSSHSKFIPFSHSSLSTEVETELRRNKMFDAWF